VRELRQNYMPWKTPTGLSELGEQIDEAAVREVLEETGIQTTFHSIIGFRQTHGLTHGRSDLFFVCQLDPIEETDVNGNIIIPDPVPQANEIEKAEWVPLSEYRAMVKGEDGGGGHPMMSHVIDVLDGGRNIDRAIVHSIVPGRKPNHVYYPSAVVDKTP
jgi:ADP-ribose pyrophosphatase YjhB (NUDIX family)